MPQFVIRADASWRIGTGHVMRCLTLADALRAQGAQVHFISRVLDGDLNDRIAASGHGLSALPAPAVALDNALPVTVAQDLAETRAALASMPRPRWLIADHYGLAEDWESALRDAADNLMAIDDVADRRHDVDLLLDQNLNPDPAQRYRGLVPAHCELCLGPAYALLRPEFRDGAARPRSGPIRRLFIFLSGSDSQGATRQTLAALTPLPPAIAAADLVVGASCADGDEIERLCAAEPRLHFHRNVDHMAALMARADLAIGGGGTTSWERAALGLPSLILVLADNQAAAAAALDAAGCARTLDARAGVPAAALRAALAALIAEPEAAQRLSRQCLALGVGARSTELVQRLLGADGR